MKQGRLFHSPLALSFWPLLLGLLCLSWPVAADDPAQVGFPSLAWGSGVEEIQEELGAPAFSANSILIYSTALVTASGTLSADLTLWFQNNQLFFASYAFPAADRPAATLSREYESISELLLQSFGQPFSRAETAGSFTTEVWDLDDAGIEHTVILEAGRADHVVNFTASQSGESADADESADTE